MSQHGQRRNPGDYLSCLASRLISHVVSGHQRGSTARSLDHRDSMCVAGRLPGHTDDRNYLLGAWLAFAFACK
jgi:hypothetical protein